MPCTVSLYLNSNVRELFLLTLLIKFVIKALILIGALTNGAIIAGNYLSFLKDPY